MESTTLIMYRKGTLAGIYTEEQTSIGKPHEGDHSYNNVFMS
jgi:hypothetical protein